MTNHQDSSKSAQTPGVSARRNFLRGGALGLVAAPLAAMMASPARAQVVGDPQGEGRFREIRQHENDHVAVLIAALGDRARPKPNFRSLRTNNFDRFTVLAQTFENVGVGAYLGALPFILDPDNTAAAGSIALIEARHAGWLNAFSTDFLSKNAAGDDESSFDPAIPQGQVRRAVAPFVVDLNGGPPLAYTPGNDISILNFALGLEYLEAEFYNLNVPFFFGN